MIYMLIASFLFSFLANFDKLAMLNSDYFFAPSVVLGFSGISFIIYSISTKRPILSVFEKNWKTTLLASVALCLGGTFTYLSWSMQIVPYVISIQRTSILFSVIFGGVLLHESGMLHRLAGALLMIVGVALIVLSAG